MATRQPPLDYAGYAGYQRDIDGGTIDGAVGKNGNSHESCNFASAYSRDSSGQWTSAGSATNSASGSSAWSYSGSGNYNLSDDATTTSGTQRENGGDGVSYQYSLNYSLFGGAWQATGGGGGSSGSGSAVSSYNETGTYTEDLDGGTLHGASAPPVPRTRRTSSRRAPPGPARVGGWTETGTKNATDNSWDTSGNSGSGSYSSSGTGDATWNTSGSKQESGSDSSHDNSNVNYTLAGDGTWQAASGAESSSGVGNTHQSYNESGLYSYAL